MPSASHSTLKTRIREASRTDIETLRDFQIAAALESEKLRLDPEICLRGVSHVFDHPTLGAYFILETCDPQPRPIACTLIQYEWSDWRNRTVVWIHSVYVVPEYRGLALFDRIYAFLKDRVKTSPDSAGLRLYVDRANERAIRVYERLGMTREHYHLYEWMK